MNTPNRKLMRELIANLLGWQWYEFVSPRYGPCGDRELLNPATVFVSPEQWRKADMDLPLSVNPLGDVPNWPDDRNIELPIDHRGEFLFAFGEIIDQKIPYWKDVPHAVVFRLLTATTIELRLAWIRYKGYRWAPCTKCNGRGEREQKNVTHKDVTRLPSCPDCHGDKGKFVKI